MSTLDRFLSCRKHYVDFTARDAKENMLLHCFEVSMWSRNTSSPFLFLLLWNLAQQWAGLVLMPAADHNKSIEHKLQCTEQSSFPSSPTSSSKPTCHCSALCRGKEGRHFPLLPGALWPTSWAQGAGELLTKKLQQVMSSLPVRSSLNNLASGL